MGVPHFYTWLINRYPLVKSSYNPSTLPIIDWLFLDLNGIIYKCALDDSSAFKDVLKGKKFEDIFVQVFNYVNEITQLIQPQKMLFLALDGVAPRAKMNQQRSRRFKSAKKYQELDNALRTFGVLEKEEHFKNNSISPGTEFMHELNDQIKFLIQRKMKEDERWRKITVVFSGVDVPGEGEHKTLEYIRRKSQQPGFNPNTTMCIYGSDSDLIMLALTTHLPFICILREQVTPRPRLCSATKRHHQQTLYEFLWINVLREYFDAEFGFLKERMGERYSVDRIIDDFVFLCFFIGNDFLPRVFCMDIKMGNFDKVLELFKETLTEIDGYINCKGIISWNHAVTLFQKMAQFELKFIDDKLEEQQIQQKFAYSYKKALEEADTIEIQSNKEVLQEVKELKEEYEELERLEQAEGIAMSSDSDGENHTLSRIKKATSISTPRKKFPRKVPGKTSIDWESEMYAEDYGGKELNDSNSYESTSKSYTGENVPYEEDILRDKKSDHVNEEEDKEVNKNQNDGYRKEFFNDYFEDYMEIYGDSRDFDALKFEDPEFYFAYSNEETVSRLFSARALENDIKFMSSLIKAYKQNKNEARTFYYKEKFGIDVQNSPSELTKILTVYIQGLQFVLSYYYTNCPSWSWFYPYYYSPLISDLADLMRHLNSAQINIPAITFKKEKPYDPFKQLLLILPLTSMHLLPEPLQNIVCNSDPRCSLSKYYPTEFQLDAFGAVFESEYIAKIPFVDEDQLDFEYEKVIKNTKLTKAEVERNSFGTDLIFEWNPKTQEHEVESTLPLYFDKFKVRIKISVFSLDDLPFDQTKILEKPPQGTYRYHKSFPSITFIQEKKIEMKQYLRKGATFLRCCIRLGQRLNHTEYKQYRKLLDQPFYCMYPFLVPCFVMGIVTPDQLITNIPYQDLPFRYKKAYHHNFYTNLNAAHEYYFNQMGVLFKESMLYFALIYLESEARKNCLGNIYPLKPRIEVIPLNFLIDTNIMPHYRGKIDYNEKKLSKEFPMHSEVVINIGPPAGSLARVIGFGSDSDFANVEVKIIRTVPKLNPVTTAIASKYDDHRKYRSVYHVAKKMGVDLQVILRVLDCLIVKTEIYLNNKSIYPERFDIGLNLIQRKCHTIVPELVICNELRKQKSRNTTFPHFQLAPEAISLLKDYYNQHRAVFEAIAKKIRLGDPSPLTAQFIFPNAQDPNLEAFKIYIWILKQLNSNLGLTNKASKVIPREGIRELEKVLGESKNYLGEQAKHILNKVFPYNPNFLIPKSIDNWVPPFYSKQPPWHKLGDRVVNLRVDGYNFAPFGAIGSVVGILGNKPENGFLKVKIEVIFDYPFIGGNNLGGRCSWGRGSVVNFDDIFNLTRWEKCIQSRDPRRAFYNQNWDGMFPSSYVPSFQTASEISDTEEEETTRPETARPNIPNPTLPEDLLKLLSNKKRQAQVQAEKREQSKRRNKNRTYKKTYNHQKSPPKSTIIPKTLGLKRSENPVSDANQKGLENSQQSQAPKVPDEVIIGTTSPDPQSKLDFNTLISNTLPQVLYPESLANKSYPISNRYLQSEENEFRNISQPSTSLQISGPHTWEQNSKPAHRQTNVGMWANLRKATSETITYDERFENIIKSEKMEILKKQGERRNTMGPFTAFGFHSLLEEKENRRNQRYESLKETEYNDTEEGEKPQITIKISHGDNVLHDEGINLENIDNELNMK